MKFLNAVYISCGLVNVLFELANVKNLVSNFDAVNTDICGLIIAISEVSQ